MDQAKSLRFLVATEDVFRMFEEGLELERTGTCRMLRQLGKANWDKVRTDAVGALKTELPEAWQAYRDEAAGRE